MSWPDRKSEILDAAERLFLTVGYSGFSYSDLAERLGIAKASIHHHFPTKEALGLALVARYQALAGQMSSELVASVPTPGEQLRAFLDRSGEFACAHSGEVCPMGALQAGYAGFPESMQAATRELTRSMHAFLTDRLEAARREGEVAFDGTPEAMAWVLMSVLQGARQNDRAADGGVYADVLDQLQRLLFATGAQTPACD